MSTGTIVVIVVVALIILALLAFVLPRMRRQAQVKARERELGQRRDQQATEHQQVASQREREAAKAEQKARMAQAEAERQRSEAQMHEQKADMHQRGLADDELIEDHERDHFAPAIERRNEKEAKDRDGSGGLFSRDRDGDGVDDRQEGSSTSGGVSSSPREGGRAHDPVDSGAGGSTAAGQEGARSEYEQGRVDERESEGGRFGRSPGQPPAETGRP